MNPLELFFGHPPPLVVQLLKDRPEWLMQIIGRSKRYMLAQVHPDRGRVGDHQLSKEISEAFSALEDQSRLQEYLTEYFAKPSMANALRADLRSAKQESEGLWRALKEKKDEIESLRRLLPSTEELEKQQVTAWHWFASMAFQRLGQMGDLPEEMFPEGSVSRGRLHHYRVVVEQDEKYDGYSYTAYEFDLAGRVRLSVRAEDLSLAREVSLFRSERGPHKSTNVQRRRGVLFAGSVHENVKMPLMRAMADGLVKPYAAVRMYPVFVLADSYGKLVIASTKLRDWERQIVEIIPIKKARRELVGAGGRSQSRSNLKTRLAKHKRKKK